MMGRRIAPEPYLGAYLQLLYRAVVFARSHSEGQDRLPDGQLCDLMDALHNIPGMLCDYGKDFSHERMAAHYLESYDQKWGDKGIRLVEIVKEALDSRRLYLNSAEE